MALWIDHRATAEKMIVQNLLVFEMCELRVHVEYMNPIMRRGSAVHIGTSDTVLEWAIIEDPGLLEQHWRERDQNVVKQMEARGDKSTTTALLKIIRVEDAAKVGMQGLIRQILSRRGVPDHIFECDTVKWAIMGKWMKVWRKRLIMKASSYIVFIIIFTSFAIITGNYPTVRELSGWYSLLLSVLLLRIWLFGLSILHEEIRQMRTFMRDGSKHFDGRMWGVRHYFTSKWNLGDLASGILLVVFIPVFFALALSNEQYDYWLSGIVALETLLVYLKIWYFAQPFRVAGARILHISNTIVDCLGFLLWEFNVLLGFSLALYVLFRQVQPQPGNSSSRPGNCSTLHGNCSTDSVNTTAVPDDSNAISDAYGNIFKSFLTVFCALFGALDSDLYMPEDKISTLVSVVFVAYMVMRGLVLLNLLIAIMGDTFDRVKLSEEALLLKARAKFIDACEAALIEKEAEEMNKEIGKYLYAVVSPEEEAERERDAPWMGRLNKVEDILGKNMQRVEQKRIQTIMEEQKQMKTEMKNDMASLQQMMTSGEAGQKEKMEVMITQQEERMAERMALQAERMAERMALQAERMAEQIGQSQGQAEAMNSVTSSKLDRLLLLEKSDEA